MGNKSPIGWALEPLRKYATFSGRAPRAEFWWFFLFMVILYFVFMFVMMGAVGGMASTGTQPSLGMIGAMGAAGLFMILFWLALLIPTIAVQVRRMHDTDRSGWWIGAFYLLYLLYFVLLMGTMGSAFRAGMSGATEPSAATGPLAAVTGILAVVMMIYAIVLLVFYCLPGTKGANRYGPDPYGADVEQVFA